MPETTTTDSSAYQLEIATEQEVLAFGRRLAKAISAPCQIHLYGNLGAGKTTLTRGILSGMGYSGLVQSPTYTLIEPYETVLGQVYHLDLYRLGHGEELEYLGIRDLDGEKSICLIEWPERGQGFLPEPDLEITIVPDKSRRIIGMSPVSVRGEQVLNELRKS